jgi:hypothetical protein
MPDFLAERRARAERNRKLTYLGIALGVGVVAVCGFLPENYRWFLYGVIVGMFVAFGLLLSHLFWKPPKEPPSDPGFKGPPQSN